MRPDAGEERQLLVDLCHTLGHHEAVGVLVQLGIETDEGAFRRRHDIVITEGLLLKIDLRGAVAPQEGQQAAAVVVVRVGEKAISTCARSMPSALAFSQKASLAPESKRILCFSVSM